MAWASEFPAFHLIKSGVILFTRKSFYSVTLIFYFSCFVFVILVMMNPLGMMMSGMEMEDDSSSSSNENAMEQHHNNNVISLPLKFLSNGRPAQIQNPKPRAPHPNSKYTSLKPEPSKTTHLISSGKYSFNGRPNGVFIVRSPTAGSPNSIL